MPQSTCVRLAPGLGVIAAICLSAGPVAADTSKTRLDMVGELNVLVHETAASVCMITAGVAVDAELRALAQARMAFNATLTTLSEDELADEVISVGARWAPLDVAMSMILAGDDPAQYSDVVADAQPSLEFATLQLMDQTANTHEHAAGVTMSDVLTVDLAERQEVFVQKMKLMACKMNSEPEAVNIQAQLVDIMDVYEISLAALTDGVPGAGINPPADYAVSQTLAASAYDWQGMKPVLQTIADNGVATTDDLIRLRVRANTLDARMSALVDLYMDDGVGNAPDAQLAILSGSAE